MPLMIYYFINHLGCWCRGHRLGSRLVFLATSPYCCFSSNLLPAEALEGWGENDIDQVVMNKGKEGVNILSCAVSSGSGSKKTLSPLNCSLILSIVSFLQMAWKPIAANQKAAGRRPGWTQQGSELSLHPLSLSSPTF